MYARWVFLPVLGAPLAHAPVLGLDLLPRLRRPIDGGRTLGGRRLLGDNKTWRGAAAMSAGVAVAAAALSRVPSYRARLPPELRRAGPARWGALLALATVGGELPNSFLKRRLGIAPGGHRASAGGVVLSVVDQADVVLAAWLLLAPVWRMPAREVAEGFAVVAAAHLPVNLAGYALGVRSTPI
ncbi:MAG: CDP-2,3-bis-(O-geranylgeranyl)-sn-glycerol synthase [Solirubrobacteraceae bacterium]|jgi:CDP-2,3-bis-(O-geranylgeranyl)-sn-glycerol synthase|nr:CDP-2,3-bis-(O-geranylgeranyl)-sn-glycerol synthase [Solirubrobacteraceae bacterium]